MKKLILLALLGVFTINITAQKAKTRSVGFRYYHLPYAPLHGAVNTYATIIHNTSTKVKLDGYKENNYLVLQGFDKTDPSKAGVVIEFSIYGVQSKADIKTKEITKKVDDKEVKITKYYYYISSKTSAEFKLKYISGQTIKSANFNGGSYLYENESDLYDTNAEALTAFNKNKKALVKNADDSGLELVLEWVKSYLDNNHGYYYTTAYASISTGKGKKHDYSDLDEANELYKTAAVEYGTQGISQGFIDKSNKCIDVWKSAISEFDANNKKARISKKNIDKLYANIAYAYLYMNEFEKARQTVRKALTVGKSEGTEKSYIKKINDREYRYKANEKRKLEASSHVNTNSSTTSSTTTSSTATKTLNKKNNTTTKNNNIVNKKSLTIGAAVAIPIKGINTSYRVKKVSKTYTSSMNEYLETTSFHYNGSSLKYKIKDANKRVDSTAYSYNQGNITETTYYYVKGMGRNWKKDEKKTITYDLINNLVVKKVTRSEELIYKYNGSGGLEALIRKKLLYDNIMYKYTFHFNSNKLSQVKSFRFRDGEWLEEEDMVLNFNHRNYTVKQAEYGTVYELDYRNGPLSRIQKYKNFNVEKEDMSYIFFYDADGNINKQKFKNSFGNTETYEIEYEQDEGNEELFLGTKDWRANTFFHQITFNDFFEADY